jgi:putative transposase
MLTNEEMQNIFIRKDIPLKGRKIAEAIRSSQPSRRVGGGTHNVACRFASQKMHVVIQAESHKCELPWCYVWEHDPNTYEFYDQAPPVMLSYASAKGRRATHPYTLLCHTCIVDRVGRM